MSIGSKKKDKDKDKDAKAASGGEASANYIIEGEGRGEERSTTTTGKQEPISPATANTNKLSTTDDISATQREKMTSPTSNTITRSNIDRSYNDYYYCSYSPIIINFIYLSECTLPVSIST